LNYYLIYQEQIENINNNILNIMDKINSNIILNKKIAKKIKLMIILFVEKEKIMKKLILKILKNQNILNLKKALKDKIL